MNETKEYAVKLTEKEMQCIANALSGFFNRLAAEKKKPSEEYAMNLMSALNKFKAATDIVVVIN